VTGQASSVLDISSAWGSPISWLRNMLGWWEGLERPFQHLPRAGALAILVVLAAAMVWSAWSVVPIETATDASSNATQANSSSGAQKGDLALYRRISERVSSGESYYAAAVAEQEASNYPTRPFVTVRQPTLAWMQSILGLEGVRYFAIGVLIACFAAFHMRFAKRLSLAERAGGLLLLAIGGIAATIPIAGLVHEIVAGLLLTFAFLAYDPKRYWPSLIAAALAISIREISVPFAALWFAYSLAQNRWREAAAVGAVMMLFALGMVGHSLGVEAYTSPDGPQSQGWEALAGYSLPIAALLKLTFLQAIPPAVAAPIALLPLVGWLGLGGRAGLFAVLWCLGHFTALALFARPENFYWVQLILPAYLIGLVFAPRALRDLFVSASSSSLTRSSV
jgi:hypothetical protein